MSLVEDLRKGVNQGIVLMRQLNLTEVLVEGIETGGGYGEGDEAVKSDTERCVFSIYASRNMFCYSLVTRRKISKIPGLGK